jgi:tRNA threonylcarbamoyladenosine biosynthesis protein TsaB
MKMAHSGSKTAADPPVALRILALETSGTTGSVAALDRSQVLAESTLPAGQRSAQSLAPAMRDLLVQAGWQPRDVQLVAVAIGPGSFTGLRVGVTTAKTFAYAVGADLIGVNTLEAIAWQAPAEIARVATAIDAQRGEVFAANYIRQADGRLELCGQQCILENDAWLAQLETGWYAIGPAVVKLAPKMAASVNVAPAALGMPMASTVGRIAALRHTAGVRDDIWKLVPTYLRRSAAEEKWDAKQTTDDATANRPG